MYTLQSFHSSWGKICRPVSHSKRINYPDLAVSQLTLPGHNLGRKWHWSALAAQTSLKQLLCSLTGSFPRNIHWVSAYPGTRIEKQQYKIWDRACQGLSIWEGFSLFLLGSNALHLWEANFNGMSITWEKERQDICHCYCLKKALQTVDAFTAWLWGKMSGFLTWQNSKSCV